jgi:hypothetical protein
LVKLEYVGGDIFISMTPLAYRKNLGEILKKVKIKGNVVVNHLCE